ncbi:MAG: long-chain-acyl-CoA synthetase [Burkholderiales bacterium RIFCSPLOWO2_12_FULL_64_99]|nr:MAG: long-chain-acyl-CoA synthetase [Burkholderiales bacterium RIFCSPHIGHO2_12_FULL_63_20]OGB67204.1 MAG: long-chain-acyl-CoA synthetase [Burkholderiales bacterium RIFCSPLOWO2_12_FULL_64_99]
MTVSASDRAPAAPNTIGLLDWIPAAWRTVRTDALLLLKGVGGLLTLRPTKLGSIGQTFANQAARHPERPALVCGDRRWTYAELNAWANRCAHALKSAGVRPGDAVGVLLDNRAEVLAWVLGTVKLGAVATLLNNQQRGEVLAHSIRLTRPTLVVVGEACAEALHSLPPAERATLSAHWWWEGETSPPEGLGWTRDHLAVAPSHNPPETAAIRLHQPAFHIFTSGTTGLPKASVMSHYRWHRCMSGMGIMGLRLRPEDILYCPLPLYHNNALTVSWGAVVGAGACLVLAPKFSASRFWDDIRRHQATSFCYIGELCRYLLNQPARPDDRQHRVRAMIGNGLRPEIWDAFQQRFGIDHIAEFYTASECNLAFINALGLPRTTGLCPLSFAIVRMDLDTEQPVRSGRRQHMSRVNRGEVGLLITEITTRAPLDGYTDAKATEAKVLRNVFKKGDAWFNTGDLVRHQGLHHMQFVDRLGDTFRWKGENVATTEVEGVLAHQSEVAEAVVYGVTVPGADGRAGMAALTLSDDAAPFDGAALARVLCAQLPRYAVPLFLRLRDDHVVTATFKYSKVALKREGYDPTVVHDAMYVLTPDGYVPMTATIWLALSAGTHRFD